MKRSALGATLAATAVALLAPVPAHAFCGFYVGGAESSLYNDATMVVMMRDGTRTVLSMQNSYQGPPENFAMVVPVPQVLQQENVRTLPDSVFATVDRLAAPRLVEYWEQDPCAPPPPMRRMRRRAGGRPMPRGAGGGGGSADLGVRVEAQFEVGEYDIVILSANDSSGLDTWLRREGYHIPADAEPALRPYVQQGTKFFVARVDISRVTFANGRAVLSPLRVHYDSDTFSLPVRLGLINSNGTQDLIVHILAQNQRYELANYPNVFIPTNVRVRNNARGNFGAFYTALFDKTLQVNPGAVVTEYAWQAGSCDPCPGPVLSPADIATLGADVARAAMPSQGRGGFYGTAQQWTLTRLHYRYGTHGLDQDLVFRSANGVVGGRGVPSRGGIMDRDVQPSAMNNFQGRYAILHWWNRRLTCEHPRRGEWGGPPNGGQPPGAEAAQNLATQPRSGVRLERFLRAPLPELSPRRRGGGARGVEPGSLDRTAWKGSFEGPSAPEPASATAALTGCATHPGPRDGALLFSVMTALLALVWRRRG